MKACRRSKRNKCDLSHVRGEMGCKGFRRARARIIHHTTCEGSDDVESLHARTVWPRDPLTPSTGCQCRMHAKMSMEVSVTHLIPLNMIPSQCAWTGYQESIEYMNVLYGADLQIFIGQRNDKRPKNPQTSGANMHFALPFSLALCLAPTAYSQTPKVQKIYGDISSVGSRSTMLT
jgi:hypothetical protein